VPLTLERAQETWRRGSTLSGILDIVREIREKKINYFLRLFQVASSSDLHVSVR
jgi:hypothetical protein